MSRGPGQSNTMSTGGGLQDLKSMSLRPLTGWCCSWESETLPYIFTLFDYRSILACIDLQPEELHASVPSHLGSEQM